MSGAAGPKRMVGLALIVALTVAACGGDDDDQATTTSSGSRATAATSSTTLVEALTDGTVRRVPGDYDTIQDAVTASVAGDLVLIEPGVYSEEVTVTKPDLVIRGLDRGDTILDGGFDLENGFKILSDGVAVENLTVRGFTDNGIYWTGAVGFRASYLTALNNGHYGVYAFDSSVGQFDHLYAAGNGEAGIYVGQCDPCDTVVTDVVAEWNNMGYSGTNASTNMYVVNSTWRFNSAGIVPNSGTYEAESPQHDAVFAGNTVYGNGNDDAPGLFGLTAIVDGGGIVIAGGLDNVVEHNLVYDNEAFGIAVMPFPERESNPDNESAIDWEPSGNVVRDNNVRDNGVDLFLLTSIERTRAADALGNCFADNAFGSASPPDLPVCDAVAAFAPDLEAFLAALDNLRNSVDDYDFALTPDGSDQPDMPDAATARAVPASIGVPMAIDLDAIETPTE